MLKSSESNCINYLIGQNNVGQCDEIFRRCRKFCSTKNDAPRKFCPRSLHLRDVLLDKSDGIYFVRRKFCPTLFCSIRLRTDENREKSASL